MSRRGEHGGQGPVAHVPVDLRHSFASRALALGETLPVIGKLLGHSQVQTTTPYARLARDAIQSVVARITGSIGDNLSSMLRFDDTAKR